MGDDSRDWLSAAACTEGPRPAVTFADLPPQHQEEMVRLVLVAAAAAACFVLVIWSAPLASRSLAGDTAMPNADPPPSAALAARAAALSAQAAALETPRPLAVNDTAPAPPRVSRPRPAVTLAALREPTGGRPASTSAPRRNPFSRFFRGVLRTVSPD
jgi:hypothetical protein